jgi:acetoacetyl-CoA synthetase
MWDFARVVASQAYEKVIDLFMMKLKKIFSWPQFPGGKDINGCFALGNPMGPVYAGELQ